MKIVTFLRKNDYLPKRVVDFPLERDTFRNKIMEIVEDFDEKSYNNNGKTLEIVEDFACEAKLLHFSLFFHFFIFLFSFSFIFFHFVGCSKSGINFVTISIDSSYVKNQFWGPSRVFLFFLLFCSPFSCFFHFSHFLFFIFCFVHVFHFPCSFFLKQKVSSFLFSCVSFKYVLLLALASEFNCFLRGRCSMEMWYPDDIGRDSWDWVGPPAWERACFNSPEWGGGSSPVETEPPQIVLLLNGYITLKE